MYRTRGIPRNLWKFQERTFPRKVWEKAVPNFICVTMVHLFQNSEIRKLLARDIQLNLEQHGFNCVGCFVFNKHILHSPQLFDSSDGESTGK